MDEVWVVELYSMDRLPRAMCYRR